MFLTGVRPRSVTASQSCRFDIDCRIEVRIIFIAVVVLNGCGLQMRSVLFYIHRKLREKMSGGFNFVSMRDHFV